MTLVCCSPIIVALCESPLDMSFMSEKHRSSGGLGRRPLQNLEEALWLPISECWGQYAVAVSSYTVKPRVSVALVREDRVIFVSILKLLSPHLGLGKSWKPNNVFSVNMGLSGLQFSRLIFETKVGFGPGRLTAQNTSQHKPWQRVRAMFALQTTSLVLRKNILLTHQE